MKNLLLAATTATALFSTAHSATAAPHTFDLNLSFSSCSTAATAASPFLSPDSTSACNVTGTITLDLFADPLDASFVSSDIDGSVGGARGASFDIDFAPSEFLTNPMELARFDAGPGPNQTTLNLQRSITDTDVPPGAASVWTSLVADRDLFLTFALADLVAGATELPILAASLIVGRIDLLGGKTNLRGSAQVVGSAGTASIVSAVPIPASALLLTTGLFGLALKGRRRK